MVALLATGIAALLWSSPATAGTDRITVTVTHDGSSEDETIDCDPAAERDCTLRAAIETASPGATIELGTGTYELDDEVVIDHAVTIKGAGRGKTTIVANGDHRHLRIDGATTGTITISDLTLKDGGGTAFDASGGSVLATGSADFDIRDVKFDSNRASVADGQLGGAAMFDQWSGAITIRGSLFTGNRSAGGGAIYFKQVSGTAEITDTEFVGNASEGSGGNSGGAILSVLTTGSLEITESSFVDNSAGGMGGALSLQAADGVIITRSVLRGNGSALGGGAFHLDAGSTLTVENSTLRGNSGPASVIENTGSTATLRFVTIAPHADAFASNGTLAVINSALAGVTGCAAVDTSTGSVADAASDASCGSTRGDDLLLLDDVEPPLFLPLPSSLLVGAAVGDCPPTDQRGVARGGDCTAGAVEVLGILCPPEPLPRNEAITCALDVAVAGSGTHVLAQMNPVAFDGNVPLNSGAGDFTFTIANESPGDAIDIAVAGGLYSATLSVVPIDGGGPGDGDNGGGSDGGDDNGTDNGSGDGSGDNGSGGGDGNGSAGSGGSDMNGGGPTGATTADTTSAPAGGDVTELAFTGVPTSGITSAGVLAIVVGLSLLRTGGRARGQAPDGHRHPATGTGR
jgi:hypothetical protein